MTDRVFLSEIARNVLLADEGVYFFNSQDDLLENLQELAYEYQSHWQGPGWYQIDFDAKFIHMIEDIHGKVESLKAH